ncbi:hypothetical protein [Streptomyces chiangmaiensis]|uniref:Uncharacterized protein n=1 Tax=Streptomyces chiangmaiensis TaxID=766497 RepID=A0ABU7FW87_9ACTN|nr:hypothetical protein [Streptomyces chiangmaiensis]MED7827778.1 hypothetical protein [Streptomyces chiangmaiensis]
MSDTYEIAYATVTLGLITALAIGASVLLGRHAGTRPRRLRRPGGRPLSWRWSLRRERSRARERELRLLSDARAQVIATWLAGENPRRSPEVRNILQTLGNAAFDADLIGAWDKVTRPYVFENQGGQYRFGLPQS